MIWFQVRMIGGARKTQTGEGGLEPTVRLELTTC
jgi:hypothetical protein